MTSGLRGDEGGPPLVDLWLTVDIDGQLGEVEQPCQRVVFRGQSDSRVSVRVHIVSSSEPVPQPKHSYSLACKRNGRGFSTTITAHAQPGCAFARARALGRGSVYGTGADTCSWCLRFCRCRR